MKLTIIQVGDVEASNRYVRNKVRDCEEIGIAAEVIRLDAETTTSVTAARPPRARILDTPPHAVVQTCLLKTFTP